MPLINVQIVQGRSAEQKRNLMRSLVDTLGAPEQTVRVLLTEIPPEHWGVGYATKADEKR